MDLPLQQRLFYFFPVLFSFCLPFGSLLISLVIVLWTICSFFNLKDFRISPLFQNRGPLIAVMFFLLTIISGVLSDNKEEAVFSVEVKMSFLLFPYLFFCFSWPVAIIKRTIVSYVSGCFFACLYLVIRATIFSFQGHPEYFYYSGFSDLMHTSYFAMHIVMALVFVVVLYPVWFRTERAVIYSSWFFAAIFIASIFLCASKLGLISLVLCGIMLSFHKWKVARVKGLLFALAAGLLAVVLLMFVPAVSDRMNTLFSFSTNGIDKGATESTAVRALIWKEGIKLVAADFWFGTGVADANDALYDAYKLEGLTGAYELKLNAHNQYLQTFIGMGVTGVVVLILLTFGELVKGFLRNNFLLLVFSSVVILNFMVESMLQRAAGVLFFMFFLCLFNLADQKRLTDESHM